MVLWAKTRKGWFSSCTATRKDTCCRRCTLPTTPRTRPTAIRMLETLLNKFWLQSTNLDGLMSSVKVYLVERIQLIEDTSHKSIAAILPRFPLQWTTLWTKETIIQEGWLSSQSSCSLNHDSWSISTLTSCRACYNLVVPFSVSKFIDIVE